MSRTLAVVSFALAMGASAVAHAQPSAPEVVVRQGDTIQWVAAQGPPHKVRFGSSGATPVPEIDAILTFNPLLVNGEGTATSGTLLTATVKEDPSTVGKTFIFTCALHPAQMLSLPFVVAAKVAGQPPPSPRPSRR